MNCTPVLFSQSMLVKKNLFSRINGAAAMEERSLSWLALAPLVPWRGVKAAPLRPRRRSDSAVGLWCTLPLPVGHPASAGTATAGGAGT